MIVIKIEETMAEISIILMAIPHFSCVHTKLLVQFSPVGQYFASASHDRTARIWSMDRIQPLRIMAGHLSDVDVSSFYIYFIGLVVWIWLQQSSS
jgi:WD40 repeat protein